MKGSEEQPNMTPSVSILEGGDKAPRERGLSAIPDAGIRNPAEVDFGERNDNFSKAYNAIVGNEKLEVLTVNGIKGKPNAFSERTNRISEICISLLDEEIDRIIKGFVETLRKKANHYAEKFDLTTEQKEALINGFFIDRKGVKKYLFDSIGVKTLAHFVRARKKLHQASPETVPAFFFENHLDFTHKIDLIEVVETGEGVVLNLIQLKSNPYSDDELEKYHQAHREWISDFTVDLAGYERAMAEQPKDAENIGEFMKDVKTIDEAFINFLVGESFSKEDLFESLHIGRGRNKAQRIWIIREYSELLRKEILKLKDDGVLQYDEFSKLDAVLSDLELELQVVLKKRKDLTGIKEAYSICAVGEREVSKKLVFEAKGNKRKAIKITKPN